MGELRVGAASIAGVVDRPRLSTILDSDLLQVCVVQGPSGSGKTTLVRSWALQQTSDHPVAWISVNKLLASRHSFWQHVVNSAHRLGLLADDTARSLSDQLTVTADPIRIATALVAESRRLTLVFDTYENLGALTPEIDNDVTRIVATVPTARVLITTRGPTALADQDLPAGRISRVITMSELAFTPDEIHTLVASQTGLDDVHLARSIARSTRGYALEVRAAVLAVANLGTVPRADSAEWSTVLESRLEALLPDPLAARFVADTSVPPYFDIDLAARLTGHPDAEGLLSVLERNGFGRWIPYARGRPVFQYVEAVRDVFRTRAADDDERLRRSSRTTAHWLLDNGDLDQSLQFAIAGGDYATAQLIFLLLLITDPDSYISDRFLVPLQQIPHEELEPHPLLAFALGLALMANPILRQEAPSAFAISIASTAMPVNLSPQLDRFCSASLKAVARRLIFRFRESADASLEAAQLVDAIDADVVEQFREHIGTILRQLSYSLLQGGKIDDALVVMARSAALCVNETSRNYSIAYAAGTSAFAGDIAKAKAFQLAIDTSAWPADLRQSYMNGLGLVAEGFIRLDSLDFAGALDVLGESESYIQTAEFWPFLTAISMAARFGLGQGLAEAERVTAELSKPVPPPGIGDNVGTELLNAWLAHLWLQGGEPRRAAGVLENQRADSPHLAWARVEVLLEAGHARRALDLASVLLELPGHTLRSRAATQTVAAVAAARQGAPDVAISLLNRAAVIYETYGARLHVARLPLADRVVLLELARRSGSTSLQHYLELPTGVTPEAGRPTVELTPRERVVLAALAEHGTTRSIAHALVVSPHTIKSQLHAIYRKLGVSSRDSALRVAREYGLLDRTEVGS